jgi:hypothetical protein
MEINDSINKSLYYFISTIFIVQSTERYGGHHHFGKLDVAWGMLATSRENDEGITSLVRPGYCQATAKLSPPVVSVMSA